MTYDWYKIFNLTEFNALNLVSRLYSQELEDLGVVDVLVCKGNEVSVLFDETYLVIGMSGANPVEFEDHAVYLDENQDVWIGYLNED